MLRKRFRRYLGLGVALVMLLSFGSALIESVTVGTAGASVIATKNPPVFNWKVLGGSPFVEGGVKSPAAFETDITSARAATAMQEEGLNQTEIGAVKSDAKSVVSCSLTENEPFVGMSEGLLKVIVHLNTVYKDANVPKAPAWCETVTIVSVTTHKYAKHAIGIIGNTTYFERETVKHTVKTVIYIVVPEKCGNIGLQKVLTTAWNKVTKRKSEVTLPVTPPTSTPPTTTPTPVTPVTPPTTPTPTTPVAQTVACTSLTLSIASGTTASANVQFASNTEVPPVVYLNWSQTPGSDDVTTLASVVNNGTAIGSHPYLDYGTFTVIASVFVNGQNGPPPASQMCEASITFSPPVAVCNNLTLTLGSGNTVNATATYEAQGAINPTMNFTWSTTSTGADGPTTTLAVANSPAGSVSSSYDYGTPGSYTVYAVLLYTNSSGITLKSGPSQECSASITIPTPCPPTPPCKTPCPKAPCDTNKTQPGYSKAAL